jgi:phosphatidate cytidylyltransferase
MADRDGDLFGGSESIEERAGSGERAVPGFPLYDEERRAGAHDPYDEERPYDEELPWDLGSDETPPSTGTEPAGAVEEEPPSYRSGRVRIIGAEPAGDTVREVTGPVVEEHPDLLHWNEPPTGQVPAVLDRGDGEDQPVAPPSWREEDSDWAAHEELFEPSMLSQDLPAVGALLGDTGSDTDVERQPWHFDPDDTLVIIPEHDDVPAEQAAAPVAEPVAEQAEQAVDEEAEAPDAPQPVPAATVAASAAAASRLSPPQPPEPRHRVSHVSRSSAPPPAASAKATGTRGRDMPVAIGSGVVLGIIALVCFASGTVATMVIATIVVLLATAEAYAAFRRAQYHPATLLGLVAVLSLMIEAYNKGVAAMPLVTVLLVAGAFIWYLARVEPSAEPVTGLTSTVFVFVWVGVFGSFTALLLDPNVFPDRHGIAFILAAVIVTVADDIASLLVGSSMGRHPLAPSISPNKSWEGLIGGALAAILVSVVVVHFIHPWTVSKALVYGVVVAVVAPLGDLSQSMIKRNLGIKDMGRLVPGHGGVLDRVDSLLFVVPATYFVVKALNLG